MDVAYNQHSHHSRRAGRSSTNLNHLSLAPLTSRLPLNDPEELPEPAVHSQSQSSHDHRFSYLEGKSAPTTPGILSRSSSRVSLRRQAQGGLAKSKSSTNIINSKQNTLKSGLTTPGGRPKRPLGKDDLSFSSLTASDRNDSDWLLRAGALISTGTRESKGQTWLVSRASSTSLTGQKDEDEEALERELARERSSRRGSTAGGFGDADDEFSPITTRMSFGGGSRSASRYGSRPTSRIHSRRGSRANLASPSAVNNGKEKQGYFDGEEQFLTEPDFIDVDEDVDDGGQAAEDEVIVRRLAKNGSLGLGIWVERLMGWSLFAVDEDGEDSDTETNGEKTDTSEGISRNRSTLKYNVEGSDVELDEKLPPPGDEEGGWQDAAWLLSVASKVLL
jgi:hypothetical protein